MQKLSISSKQLSSSTNNYSSMSVNDRGATLATTDEVMMVQETMKVLGLYDGAVDGLAGSKTFRAVRAYKKVNHMAPNNALTQEFINYLRENS